MNRNASGSFSSKLAHAQSTPAGVDGSGMSSAKTPPTTPKRGGKMISVRVQMLDDSITVFQVQVGLLTSCQFLPIYSSTRENTSIKPIRSPYYLVHRLFEALLLQISKEFRFSFVKKIKWWNSNNQQIFLCKVICEQRYKRIKVIGDYLYIFMRK